MHLVETAIDTPRSMWNDTRSDCDLNRDIEPWLLEGLKLCVALGFHLVLVEIDSLVLLWALNSKKPSWRIDQHIPEIKSIMWSGAFKITHVFRQSNSAADALTKIASSTRRSSIFQASSLPKHIVGLVSLDKQRIPYIRLVYE